VNRLSWGLAGSDCHLDACWAATAFSESVVAIVDLVIGIGVHTTLKTGRSSNRS
jgi:hypothetical protein